MGIEFVELFCGEGHPDFPSGDSGIIISFCIHPDGVEPGFCISVGREEGIARPSADSEKLIVQAVIQILGNGKRFVFARNSLPGGFPFGIPVSEFRQGSQRCGRSHRIMERTDFGRTRSAHGKACFDIAVGCPGTGRIRVFNGGSERLLLRNDGCLFPVAVVDAAEFVADPPADQGRVIFKVPDDLEEMFRHGRPEIIRGSSGSGSLFRNGRDHQAFLIRDFRPSGDSHGGDAHSVDSARLVSLYDFPDFCVGRIIRQISRTGIPPHKKWMTVHQKLVVSDSDFPESEALAVCIKRLVSFPQSQVKKIEMRGRGRPEFGFLPFPAECDVRA